MDIGGMEAEVTWRPRKLGEERRVLRAGGEKEEMCKVCYFVLPMII
jgi:hypothetical protein